MLANTGDEANIVDGSQWVLVTSRPEFFSRLLRQASPIPASERAWTDDFSNLWQALR